MTDLLVTEKRIDVKTLIGTKTGIIQSIKYPFFEVNNASLKKLSEKMNAFYEKTARKYSAFGEKILSKKVRRMAKKFSLPLYLAMKCTVSTVEDSIVSVVLDLSFSDGKNMRMRRFTQMWSTQSGGMLTTGELLKLTSENKKYIFDLVQKQALKQSERENAEFFSDVKPAVKKHFCFDNCFASPSGIVFFFDAGTLRHTRYGPTCFVVPYEKLADIIKLKEITGVGNGKEDL